MKRCPKCNRTYSTDTQKFCTHDGGLLFIIENDLDKTVQFDSSKVRDAVAKPTTRDLGEHQPAFDPEATVVRSAPAPPVAEAPPIRARDTGSLTSPQPTQHAISMPPQATTTGPMAPTQSAPPPPPPVTPPPPAPQTSAPLPPTQVVSGPIAPVATEQAPPPPSGPIAPPAAVVAQPSQPLPAGVAPAKKRSKLPLILGLIALVLVLFGGVVAVGGYLWWKQQRKAHVVQTPTVTEPTETAPSLPTDTATPTEASKPSNEPPPYNPPADAEQFVNSKDQLSGRLAENFVAFSFYYPNRWEKDAKAGTGDSTNFVEVHRQLPPNFPQESLAVSWYDLQGDANSFSDLAAKKNAQLEKAIGQYRKVSEGPTKVGTYDGYELRFEGQSEGTEKGDLTIWGRVVWLPSSEGSKTGVALLMFATSLTPDVHSIDDVGVKGELPMLLESFRFGK
ncbi:MAG TPA: hypothetical protein VFD75_09995 [Pyrinomonadaceae bacterium]|nr:hypothetical protein [Pyrinomonadaceae bacterium]